MTTATAPASRARSRTEADVPLLALSELALAAVTFAAVLGLRRVFLDSDWFGPLALQVGAAHLLAAGARRRGLATAPSIVLVVAAGALAIGWIHAGETTAFGVPTGDTLDALRTLVDEAATVFSEVKAPTDALPGFLVIVSAAVWVIAALADWAAFRVDAPLEATLPTATLFVLAAILGADVDRLLLTAFWLAAVLVFLLLRRADRLGHTAAWVGERRRHGPRAMVLLGCALIAAAVGFAALSAPRLPGADSEAIVSLTDLGDDGPGTRVVVSPLVDIRTRLVDQADVEVFTVRSPRRSYWRLTSLDEFDGQLWSSSGSYGKAGGDLDDGVPVASDRITFDQTFSIAALAQIWLPAAYEPQRVDATVDLRYDEVSGTLIVEDDGSSNTSDGTDYRVTSALPQHDPAALATAADAVPQDIADRYLGLPDDFPSSVATLAAEITDGASTRYDQARAMQDWFRAEFDYDLEVGAGHSESAIEDFLFETRRGYCEQFAGSFAAMARSIGIPARVAVGFTPGLTSATDPTLYRVRGEHAHAWPELYLGEYGWVLFEPTPGRGAPFAEQYTGVAEQQVASGTGDPNTATTTPATPSTQPPEPGEFPSTTLRTPDLGQLDTGAGEDGGGPDWWGRIRLALAVVVGAGLLYVVAVVVATAWRRYRRRHAAVDPSEQVGLAWEDSIRAVRRAGIAVRDSATQREAAAVVGSHLPEAAEPMGALAVAVEDITYAPSAPSEDAGGVALATAGDVERIAVASMPPAERLRTRLHPRRLVRD